MAKFTKLFETGKKQDGFYHAFQITLDAEDYGWSYNDCTIDLLKGESPESYKKVCNMDNLFDEVNLFTDLIDQCRFDEMIADEKYSESISDITESIREEFELLEKL